MNTENVLSALARQDAARQLIATAEQVIAVSQAELAAAAIIIRQELTGTDQPPAPAPSDPAPPPGSAQTPLATIAPGKARNIGPWFEPNTPNRPLSPGGRTDYSCVAYDPVGKRILMRGGHHGLNVTTNIRALNLQTLTFSDLFDNTPTADMTLENYDVEVGRWKSTDHPVSRHTYNGNLVLNGKFWMMAMQNGHQAMNGVTFPPCDGRVASYDLQSGKWAYSSMKGLNWFMMVSACAVGPHHILVLRVLNGWGETHLYDTQSDSKVKLNVAYGTAAYVGDPCVAAYPLTGKVYAFQEDGKVYEVTVDPANPAAATSVQVCAGWPDGTDHRLSSKGQKVRLVRMDYDPVNKVFGGSLHRIDGATRSTFMTFDPRTATWAQHAVEPEGGTGTPNTSFWCGAFDPESGCYVAFNAANECWAYRPPSIA